MKRIILIGAILIASVACCKTTYHYEYRNFDMDSDSRLKTAEGRNRILEEMQAQGWELADPREVRTVFTNMTFRRKVRDAN